MDLKDTKVREMFKKLVTAMGIEKNFVWLREDSEGRYIEYAFVEGRPHDERCLSWYDKPHPIAWARNGYKNGRPVREVDKIYELSSFDCGECHKKGVEHCSPGHPRELCMELQAKHWTYEEPVKCACWYLHEVDLASYRFKMEDILKAIESE